MGKVKMIADQEDLIIAERYLKFLVSPRNYPYAFGFLVEVILGEEEKNSWVKRNIKIEN